MIFISVGREPDFKIIAKLFADSLVKLPVIWPLPPVIASLITGAVISAPSKTISNLDPTFYEVIWAKRSEPILLKEKATTGSF